MKRTFLRSVLPASLVMPVLLMLIMPFGAAAQTETDTPDLMARNQVRLETLDSELRGLRGVLETEIRNLHIQLDEQLAETSDSADLSVTKIRRELNQEIARLDDAIKIMEQRLRRTIELSSDIEFRVLRLEKRVETLVNISLSADQSGGGQNTGTTTKAQVQDDTIAGGPTPSVNVSRDEATGEASWTVNEDAIELQDRTGTETGADNKSGAGRADVDGTTIGREDSGQDNNSAPEEAAVAKPVILPDASSEEQYKFALSRALQNDLDVAERAFLEFRQLHPADGRAVDALFWLGRVQMMQEQYEKAAMTFTSFHSEFPSDSRIVDTTLWIAESVSKFAKPKEACAIYASLPQLLDAPTDNFTQRLSELSKSANCN